MRAVRSGGAPVNEPDLRQCRAALDHDVFAGDFSLRRLSPDDDLDLVHTWMNDPEIARFWRMSWPPQKIASYLQQQDRSAHSTAYLGELDGVPMSYWELYRADLDALAQHYVAREHDAGLHLLLGPAECRGHGLGASLLHAVSSWQLDADPDATRVVAEPDAENKRAIRAFERAGFRRTVDFDLPHKRAALMIRDR
jgi:acetyl CoA:N6-hydroxylysine acetyl transferase